MRIVSPETSRKLLPVVLILFILEVFSFPFVVGITYANQAQPPDHILTYAKNKLVWNTPERINDEGVYELSLFSDEYEGVKSKDGRKVIAPGTEGGNVVRLVNGVKGSIEYYAILYKKQTTTDLNVNVTLSGDNLTDSAFPSTLPDGVAAGDIVRSVKGSLRGSRIQDFDIRWVWDYHTSDAQDLIDTALGSKTNLDGLEIGLYIVVEDFNNYDSGGGINTGTGGNGNGIIKPSPSPSTAPSTEPTETPKPTGKPDVDIDIDTDGDGKPDINIDTDNDKEPEVNIDTDGDLNPDVNVDTDGDLVPDINIDTNDDWKPDINIDTDDDKKPDINIDTDNDKEPEVNIDTNGDKKPDINIDTNEDLKPDINVDIDNDLKPEINIDTDNDNEPEVNIDTNDNLRPDVNVDLNEDNIPDINLDTDGDNVPDTNKVIIDGDNAYVTDDAASELVDMRPESDPNVKVPFDFLDKDIGSVEFSDDFIDAIADHGNGLEIIVTDLKVVLDNNAIKAISDQADGDTVKIIVRIIPTSSLAQYKHSLVSALDIVNTYEMKVMSGGTEITDFYDGRATVYVPFTLPEGMSAGNYSIIMLGDDGSRIVVPATYIDGCFVFETEMFEDFVLACAKPEDVTKPGEVVTPTAPKTGDNGYVGMYIALLLISFGVLILLFIDRKINKNED
ncbi:MAG: hypothetical protein Q4B31_04365 [Clostridia bacterium]|nr:hypothetical protein [Clostridia bacterium]